MITARPDSGDPHQRFPFHLFCSLVLAWMVIELSGHSCWAQREELTVTLNNGLQYEGIAFSTDSLAGGQSSYKEFGIFNIRGIADGLRTVFISKNSIDAIGVSSRNEIEIPIFQRTIQSGERFPGIKFIGPFNLKGHREFIVPWSPDDLVFTQGITKIHPRFCELKILTGSDNPQNLQWVMYIGTGTVPTPVLRSVLRNEIRNPNSPSDYLRIAELFLQADRYQDAKDEIEFIKQKFPELQDRLNDDLNRIRQVEARQVLREVRLRQGAGQHFTSHSLAKVFEKDRLSNEILAEFAELEAQYPQLLENLQSLRDKVNQTILAAELVDDSLVAAAKKLQIELETELNDANAPRLDAFFRLANDETLAPDRKLSLLISGWLLGSNFASENSAVASELFKIRDLVREYLTSNRAADRERILNQILAFETGNPEEITALIQQMIPIHAPDLQEYNGFQPYTFQVEIPRPLIEQDLPPYKVRCLVHLPTEYNLYRKYPLLLALPGNNHSADQYIDLWCGDFSPRLNQRVGHASRNGYITVVVDWRFQGQTQFGSTAFEHQAVLTALRESLRKFSVDSDRVFIAGHGVGGDAALDIGLAHPEHWAGVIAVGGKTGKYHKFTWDNKHWPLPVYCVAGARDNETKSANADHWSRWVANRLLLDTTVVLYTGRGNEIFLEEVPETFKWMNAQRRRWPDRTEFEIKISFIRPWENYFWFIEMHPHSMPLDRMIFPEEGKESLPRNSTKPSLEAGYRVANNFRIARGSKEFTVWLGPDFVNFEQPVEIRISGNSRHFKQRIRPSLRVLLEDVRQRADRERPFWARVDRINNQWLLVE